MIVHFVCLLFHGFSMFMIRPMKVKYWTWRKVKSFKISGIEWMFHKVKVARYYEKSYTILWAWTSTVQLLVKHSKVLLILSITFKNPLFVALLIVWLIAVLRKFRLSQYSLINCNIYAILLLLFCIHNIVLAVYSFPTIYDIDTSRNNNVHAIHTASNHSKILASI